MSVLITGEVLIVEDNFIIAMDLEYLVRDLGATQVHITDTISEALVLIEQHSLSLAILDFNLKDTTSAQAAEALIERNIPFIFATGYSDPDLIPAQYRDRPLLKKPYTRDDIIARFTDLQIS